MGTFISMANYKFFPMAISSFGFQYVLYFFAAMTTVMVTWGFMTIKDTDRLSLTEIQDMGKSGERKKEEDKTEKVDTGTGGYARKALEAVAIRLLGLLDPFMTHTNIKPIPCKELENKANTI